MKTNLKIGDKLICHTVCRVENRYNSTTVGKLYTIETIDYDNDNKFSIIDDQGDSHFFYDRSNMSDYNKWFYSPSKQRKQKLQKINKLNE